MLFRSADLIGRERIGQLQSALLRTGHFLPGERFGRGMLPPKARISASSEFALERLHPDGTRFRLDCSAAELIPVGGRFRPSVSPCKRTRRPG